MMMMTIVTFFSWVEFCKTVGKQLLLVAKLLLKFHKKAEEE